MQNFLIKMLECPSCHGELNWRIIQHQGDRIEEAEVDCKKCGNTYPVKEGIGLFLTPDLPRNDLWEQIDSQLIQYLRENPKIESKLMDVPLNTLNPADQFFRSQVLEERGEFAQAKATANFAYSKLYAPEYLKCYNAQINYLIAQLSIFDGPIIDLASGRGDLAELLVRKLKQPIVFTDFSPQILRRNRRWLEFFGLYERVSLLAFDARLSPFKDGMIKMMTTNLGLINIEEPENLLIELRRVVSGKFFAISHFYQVDDEINAEAIKKVGLDQFLFRKPALNSFCRAGWQVRMDNMMIGRACPTPKGEVIKEAGIDAFPVAETKLEWGVLAAQ